MREEFVKDTETTAAGISAAESRRFEGRSPIDDAF